MSDAANKEKLLAIAERASHKEVDRFSPCSFLSRANDYDVRDIGKHDFRSVLLQPMLSNANL